MQLSPQILQCMFISLEFLQTNFVYDFNAIVNFGGSWGIRKHSKIQLRFDTYAYSLTC